MWFMAKNNIKKSDNKSSKFPLWAIIIIVVVTLLGLIPILLLAFPSSSEYSLSSSSKSSYNVHKVALIKINGIIMTEGSSWSSSIVSSSSIVDKINEISDSDYEGVIFEINSPGGSGVASDEIANAISYLGIPSVSYIREVGASGAYWVASSTDYIIANKMSSVGSIGVIASYLDYSGLLDKFDVKYQRFVAGDHKDFGSPFRSPTDVEKENFQETLDSLHEIFIEEVSDNRDLSFSEVESLADGSIFTAYDAMDKGLIDEIGYYDDAVYYLESELGGEVVVYNMRETSLFSELFSSYLSHSFYMIGKGIASTFLESNYKFMT